jgi:hypothetical protein
MTFLPGWVYPMLELVQPRKRSPEVKLWQQCLALLVADAAKHHTGQQSWGAVKEQERAYLDLLNQTERLKRVCAMADADPDYVCEKFRRWTAMHPQGQRFSYKNHADLA